MQDVERLAVVLAEIINPLFVLLLLAAPFIGPRRPWARPLPFWLAAAAGLAVAVALAETGKRMVVWAGHPSFPSGHETFALACGTSLLCWDRRWALAVVPLCLLMAWALVGAHYHSPADVAGALLTGPLPVLIAQTLRRPGGRPAERPIPNER